MDKVHSAMREIVRSHAERACPAHSGLGLAILGVAMLQEARGQIERGAPTGEILVALKAGLRRVRVGISLMRADPRFAAKALDGFLADETRLAEELLAVLRDLPPDASLP